MSNNTNIQKYIVQCDPGFIGYTDTGDYRLNREDDDGQEREIVMTPAEYAEEHPASSEEEFFALLHITIDNISGTQITTSSEMVDVLLDLRSLFAETKEKNRQTSKQFLAMLSQQRRVIDFYEESFGEVTIPEEWEPQWVLDMENEPV